MQCRHRTNRTDLVIACDPNGEMHWDARARRQLLVVAGDLISGGPDSPGVVRLVARLVDEAPAANSRVVVLLGNAEVRYLLRAQHPRRSLLKLDTGLKQHRSKGMLLRCDVAEALRRGLATCRASLPDGTLVELPSAAPRR